MFNDEIRKKLQNIISGAVLEGQQDHCTAIRNLLCQSFTTGPTVKAEFESRAILKKEQASFLKSYAQNQGCWLNEIPPGCRYLTRGGESQVYLAADNRHVVKLNDGVYYATWTEYLNSLIIHNLLFPSTAYSLIGFLHQHDSLHIVLQQPFIEGKQVELEDIRELLTYNGFINIKRQDYYYQEFGLLLEDMHDENVIVSNDVLFFIDTVFYIIEPK